MSGERDVPCFREMSAVLSAGIPGAELVQVPGSGHMVNMDEPEAVSELIASFVAAGVQSQVEPARHQR